MKTHKFNKPFSAYDPNFPSAQMKKRTHQQFNQLNYAHPCKGQEESNRSIAGRGAVVFNSISLENSTPAWVYYSNIRLNNFRVEAVKGRRENSRGKLGKGQETCVYMGPCARTPSRCL